jgi:hypothetical protein
MSRSARLHLSWWRLPLHAREQVAGEVESPSEENRREYPPQKETYEETAMESAASPHQQC